MSGLRDHLLRQGVNVETEWMQRLGGWDSVAEAQQGGILRARYADEWAVQADDCTYLDGC